MPTSPTAQLIDRLRTASDDGAPNSAILDESAAELSRLEELCEAYATVDAEHMRERDAARATVAQQRINVELAELAREQRDRRGFAIETLRAMLVEAGVGSSHLSVTDLAVKSGYVEPA